MTGQVKRAFPAMSRYRPTEWTLSDCPASRRHGISQEVPLLLTSLGDSAKRHGQRESTDVADAVAAASPVCSVSYRARN